jgi:hypothetical protein
LMKKISQHAPSVVYDFRMGPMWWVRDAWTVKSDVPCLEL